MLRLLMLEDDVSATELTLRTLKSAGLPCVYERAANEADFRAALARKPDLVLSDSTVLGFDGMAALEIAKVQRPGIPFIFLSSNMGEMQVRRAFEQGAAECLSKADLERLPAAIRSTLTGSAHPHRRGSDEREYNSVPGDSADSAEYLLQRQAALERALRPPQRSDLSNLLSRHPPTAAALVLIESDATRERYLKLLHTADIESDVAATLQDGLTQLATRVHALLFTDRLELIREARQLDVGSAVHMIFIHASDSAASDGLRAGANDVMPQEGRGEQFWSHLAIARRIVSFAASLQSAITDNRLLSTLDPLTGVGNRRYFEHQWPREVARAVRFGRPLSLLMCDIDHFKAINDQHGHPVGDEVLTEMGERLTRGLRLGEDWVARVGGEEFAIVLPETGRFQARAIAERVRTHLTDTPFLAERLSLLVTASLGFCSLERAGERELDLHDCLVRSADAALYESKRSGRNRVTEVLLPASAL